MPERGLITVADLGDSHCDLGVLQSVRVVNTTQYGSARRGVRSGAYDSGSQASADVLQVWRSAA